MLDPPTMAVDLELHRAVSGRVPVEVFEQDLDVVWRSRREHQHPALETNASDGVHDWSMPEPSPRNNPDDA